MTLATEAEAQKQLADMRKTIDRQARKILELRNDQTHYVDQLKQAVAESIAGLTIPPVQPPAKDTRKAGEETAIIVWSDWQLGKKTPTYTSEVCAERILKYQDKADRILEAQRADHPVKKAALFLVGDMVEGELIFPGQAHHIDASLYQQVTQSGPQILTTGVRWAASRFEQVDVYCVPGNHGYLGGRARKEMHPESNADRMLYSIGQQVTTDLPHVNWHISMEWWMVADLGERCRFLLLHGDNVRGYNGIPWYGWTRKVLAWSSLSSIWPDMTFDHTVAGHFHTPVSLYINGRRLWINASTESHNPYALEQLAAAGQPAQWLLFAKPGKGITAEYLVSLDD